MSVIPNVKNQAKAIKQLLAKADPTRRMDYVFVDEGDFAFVTNGHMGLMWQSNSKPGVYTKGGDGLAIEQFSVPGLKYLLPKENEKAAVFSGMVRLPETKVGILSLCVIDDRPIWVIPGWLPEEKPKETDRRNPSLRSEPEKMQIGSIGPKASLDAQYLAIVREFLGEFVYVEAKSDLEQVMFYTSAAKDPTLPSAIIMPVRV